MDNMGFAYENYTPTALVSNQDRAEYYSRLATRVNELSGLTRWNDNDDSEAPKNMRESLRNLADRLYSMAIREDENNASALRGRAEMYFALGEESDIMAGLRDFSRATESELIEYPVDKAMNRATPIV